jgi:DNA-binding Lrp family transcriptional regulator
VEKKELLIMSQFRQNARENLTRTSRKIGIPVSTIYDRLKRYEGTVIKKHTALLDFSQLGFSLKVLMAVKIMPENRLDLINFLEKHHRVNSLYKITSGYDVLLEGIFKNLKEYQLFCESIESFKIQNKQEFFVVEDIKQEEFLANEEFLDILSETL